MNELESLKNRLLKQGQGSEKDAVINLCSVMEVVGGYSELMEIPMSAIQPILEYIKFKKEQEAKMFGLKKKGRFR